MDNVQNTAGVNHSRCAIAEILWSRSRLAEILIFLKIGDGYVIAALPSPIWRWQYMRIEGQTMYHVTLRDSSFEGTWVVTVNSTIISIERH